VNLQEKFIDFLKKRNIPSDLSDLSIDEILEVTQNAYLDFKKYLEKKLSEKTKIMLGKLNHR